METCYKVVQVLNDEYCSITNNSIKYKIGEVKSAPVLLSNEEFVQTEFLVFKNIEDAKAYCNKPLVILVCKTEKLTERQQLTRYQSDNFKFWKTKIGNMDTPNGTYSCEKLFVESVYKEPDDFSQVFCDMLNELLETHASSISALVRTRAYSRIGTGPKYLQEKQQQLSMLNDTISLLQLMNIALKKCGKQEIFIKIKDNLSRQQELIEKFYLMD